MASGVYCVVLRLSTSTQVTVGRLGTRRLAAGWYVYVGSAKRNLEARLRRHLRREKTLHWHVDFLRTAAVVEELWAWPWAAGAECRLSGRIQALGDGIPWPGFGASDCRCPSHLAFFRNEPQWLGWRGPVVVPYMAWGAFDPGSEAPYTEWAADA